MTLTIELPDDVATQLAPLPERERNNFAVSVLRERLQQGEEPRVRARWDSLTEAEKRREQQNLRQGLDDIDAGRTRPAEEVYARLRAKIAAETLSTQAPKCHLFRAGGG